MIRALPAYLLLFAVAVHAEEWVVRSPQRGPEYSDKSELHVGATVHGALVTWTAGEHYSRTTQAALVEPGAAGTTMPFPLSHLFASDGQDYLVPSYGSAVLMRGDTGEQIRLDDPWWEDVSATALAWNGRAYVMAFNRDGYDFVTLVNSRGERISGELALGPNVGVLVACSRSSCALIANSYFPRRRAEGGLITEADFPPLGESVRLLLPHFEPALRMVRLAGNAGGFASLRYEGINQLIYERLTPGVEQGPAEGEPRRFRFARAARPLSLEGQPVALGPAFWPVSLALDGDTAYAGMPGRLLKIDGDHAHPIDLGEAAGEVAVALPAGGPVAVYISSADRQIRAFALNGDTAPPATLRVSNELVPFSNVRIGSGGGVHLAVWEEGEDALYRILGADGRPLTLPVSLADAPLRPWFRRWRFAIASSGTTFLIAWQEGLEARAALVGLDGTLLKAPFTVATSGWNVTSAVWHEGRYLIATGGRIISVTPGGEVVDQKTLQLDALDSLYLATDAGRLLGLRETAGEIICTCAPNVDYEIFEIGADLQLGSTLSTHSGSLWAGPVFAAGGGHRLLLWVDWTGYVTVGDDGELLSDYGPLEVYAGVEGAWTSSGFLVAQGRRLGYHAPGGRLLRIEQLPAGTRVASVSGDERGGIVLMLRGEATSIIASRRP